MNDFQGQLQAALGDAYTIDAELKSEITNALKMDAPVTPAAPR